MQKLKSFIKNHKRALKLLSLISLFIFIFTISMSILFRHDLAVKFNEYSAHLAYKYQDREEFRKLWSFSVRNLVFQSYLSDQGVENVPVSLTEENNPQNSFEYAEYIAKNYQNISISFTGEFNRDRVETDELIIQELQNENLHSDIVINIAGVQGERTYDQKLIKKNTNGVEYEKVLAESLKKEVQEIPERQISGEASHEEVEALVNKSINELDKTKDTITKISLLSIDEYFSANLETNEIQFKALDTKILYDDCNYYISEAIYFDLNTSSYFIKDATNLAKYNCDGSVNYSQPVEMTVCTDCKMMAIDKNMRLKASYEPPVVELSEFGSAQYLHKDAIDDFREMYEASRDAGLLMLITSGYRSYNTQDSLFSSYVNGELARGLDYATAYSNANNFSAVPGFSEHQLGTTLDLNSGGCDAFARTCFQNGNVWEWLKINAHKYGFVLSYPEGRTLDTGYIFEPWHYRWIGKEKALKYKSQEGNLTLNKWLRVIE